MSALLFIIFTVEEALFSQRYFQRWVSAELSARVKRQRVLLWPLLMAKGRPASPLLLFSSVAVVFEFFAMQGSGHRFIPRQESVNL